MTEFEKQVEKFRLHYKHENGVDLDNEIIYLFIRMNKMSMDIKKMLAKLEKPVFRSGWDYFLYGLGKWLIPSIIVSVVLIISLNVASIRRPQKINAQDTMSVNKQSYISIPQNKKIKTQ